MKVNFELNPYYHIYMLHYIHTPYKTFIEYKKWNLYAFELKSSTHLKLGFLCVLHFLESSSHAP
jgi:hypothetical protein